MEWTELTELVTTPSKKPHKARVVRPWEWWSERLGEQVIVPAGFEFDWDSVPRWPIIYWLFKGRMKQEACAHDYLYRVGGVSRRLADLVMLDAMAALGRKRRFRWPIYAAVRAGGWPAWRNNRRNA